MNPCQQIHETIVRDIVDVISNVKDFDEIDWMNRGKYTSSGSIMKKASNLVLTFPVLVSNTLTIASANLIAKAIERKCVNLLRILFSAVQITNADNMYDYVKQFHSNLNMKRMDMDDFLDVVNNFSEAGVIQVTDMEAYNAVMEDMHNLNFYLSTDYGKNPPIGYYKEHSDQYGNKSIVLTEAKNQNKYTNIPNVNINMRDLYDYVNAATGHNLRVGDQIALPEEIKAANEFRDNINAARQPFKDDIEKQRQADIDWTNRQIDAQRKLSAEYEKTKNANKDYNNFRAQNFRHNLQDSEKMSNIAKNKSEYFSKQLLPQQVQKSNELEPTIVMVNFITARLDQPPIQSTGVIGVKAKMYPVDSMDIISRITTKYSDKNTLFNLVRASTREISFFRDLAFAVDKAKLDAINMSKETENAKMFKMLERRASKNKFMKLIRKSDASPITTLVMSQDEVEYLKKYNNIDMDKSYVTRKILEAYNLMGIVITDESLEVARFLFDDGDGIYETLPFDALEKEQKDSTYKKVINLVDKMSR